jgi:hypothetical protein
MNIIGYLATFLQKSKKKKRKEEAITHKTMFTFLEINQALQKWSFEVVHNGYTEWKAISDVILTRNQNIFQHTGMVTNQHRKIKQCG